jgi:hypothetical protein
MPDNNGFILDTPLPLTARRVFGSPEMNQAVNQNAEDSASESVWTMQRFAEVSGKSWFALQERTLDGSIQRQYTGFGSELAELAARMNITPRALPAISEEQFYANLSNNVRDYELGRQFAADPSAGIPHHLAPMDLSHFSNGLTDREFEQKIRAENQTGNQSAERESLASFEQYGLDTGFETAARARTWAEDQVQQIYPAANQTLDPVPVQVDATDSNLRTRRSQQSEQQREETGAQSFGMTV